MAYLMVFSSWSQGKHPLNFFNFIEASVKAEGLLVLAHLWKWEGCDFVCYCPTSPSPKFSQLLVRY